MKQLLTICGIISLLLSLAVVGSAFFSYQWLEGTRSEIFPPPDFAKTTNHGVVIFPPNKLTTLRAIIKPPLLYPFGTWAMDDKEKIIWIYNAEIEVLKRELLKP